MGLSSEISPLVQNQPAVRIDNRTEHNGYS